MRIPGTRWAGVALGVVVLSLLATACGATREEEATPPAATEQVKGMDVVRVVLTAEAAKRLGVQTVKVASDGDGTGRSVIPYEAVLYDPDGSTWTYTSPANLVFQRKDITVARIDGDTAILTTGPRVGAVVVTAGATEIWGVEYGGIEED
jgi:hypothetical protein